MGEKEPAVFHAHEPIQSVGLSGRVVTEACFSEFQPLAIGSLKPLISVERFANEVTVCATEVLAKTVQVAQIAAFPGCIPTGDEHPSLLIRTKIVAGINCVGRIRRSGGD